MSWTLKKREEKYRNRFMTVTEDSLVTEHGQQVVFGIVHKEPAILIIPFDGDKFTMIKQYRYPVDYDSWEFPAGHYEHESIIDSAKAELREEAGLASSKFTKLGEYHIAPGHMTQICHIYLAEDLEEVERDLEPSEKGMQIGKFTLDEINQMVRDGVIKDGLTIVALKFYELKYDS